MATANHGTQTDPTHLTAQNGVFLSTAVEHSRAGTTPPQGVRPEESSIANTSAQGSPPTSPTSPTSKVPWKDQVIGKLGLSCRQPLAKLTNTP